MQTVGWYLKRLRAMSAGEIARRTWAAAREPIERRMLGRRARRALRQAVAAMRAGAAVRADGAALVPDGAGENLPAAWRDRLVRQADRIAAGGLRVFDIEVDFSAARADWNCDAKHAIRGPMGYAADIDYRDFRVAGDAKIVWEPSRHQHLVVLGRAYRATGDKKYAQVAAAHLRQWLDQCPYGHGMQWRSGLEFGVRLINWAWALELIRPAAVLSAADWERVLQSVLLHVSEIERKYSYGSSANNHLVGEAAGVYIASRYFAGLPGAAQRAVRARAILATELQRQTHADGGTGEQAIGYLGFVLQFFTLCGLVGRRTGDEYPEAYWQRLRAVNHFLAAMLEGGERLPMFGDADDGFVLDMDGDPLDVRPWLAVGAALFNDAALRRASEERAEAVSWVLGARGEQAYRTLNAAGGARLASQAFDATGYYLLQSGERGSEDAISVVFDCAPLGYGPLAAHGHADALSFVLRVGGADVLVDPGTYDYFTRPDWRTYYRGTPAHNTVTVDGENQSVMLGSFLWGARAESRVIAWEPTAAGGRIVGEHDGYRRLADPVMHRRELRLEGEGGELLVRDDLTARGRHEYALRFHLAETCRVARVRGNQIEIDTGKGTVAIEMDERLSVELVRADERGPAGWVSRGYHRKEASVVLSGRWVGPGAVTFQTRILVRTKQRGGVDAERALEGAVLASCNERSGVEVV